MNGDALFCAPTKAGGDFYLALTKPADPESRVAARIAELLGNARTSPQMTRTPEGMPLLPGARVYRVTSALPPFVVEKNGTEEKGVGPNCYQSALAAAGEQRFRGRYIHDAEFRYYLKRDYEPLPCSAAIPLGAIVVYDRAPLAFDAGDHAAFHLLGNVIFQKGGWQTHYPYEVATMDGAMKAVHSHWRPAPEDRFGSPSRDPTSGETFQKLCYRKSAAQRPRATTHEAKDRSWFLPLFKYYNRRMEGVMHLAWGDFRKGRLDLLTVENLWRLLNNFRNRLGNYDTDRALLSIDDDIAEEYLKLESFNHQYDSMAQAYDPVREGSAERQREELYQKHYVTFDRNFDEELELYLELLGAPKADRAGIAARAVVATKRYDPAALAKSGGGRGIPYLDIVRAAMEGR